MHTPWWMHWVMGAAMVTATPEANEYYIQCTKRVSRCTTDPEGIGLRGMDDMVVSV
jgi:hypothetical protein